MLQTVSVQKKRFCDLADKYLNMIEAEDVKNMFDYMDAMQEAKAVIRKHTSLAQDFLHMDRVRRGLAKRWQDFRPKSFFAFPKGARDKNTSRGGVVITVDVAFGTAPSSPCGTRNSRSTTSSSRGRTSRP